MRLRLAVVLGGAALCAAALFAAATLAWPAFVLEENGSTRGPAVPPPARSDLAAARRALAPAGSVAGWYGAPVGRRLDYDLAVAQDMAVGGRDGAPGSSTEGLRASGMLRLVVVARDGDGAVVRVHLPRLEIATTLADPAEDSAWTRACPSLVEGFLVRWSAEGVVRGWRADALEPRGRVFARALLDALAFPVPLSAGDEWSGTGRDGMGDYSATFRRGGEPPVVTRTKTGYTGAGGDLVCRPGGEATAEFDRVLGWWMGVQVRERTELVVSEASARVEARLSLRLALVAAADDGAAEHVGDEAFTVLDSAADARALAAGRIEQMQRARLAGRTVPDLVDDIARGLAAADPDGQRLHELTESLAWLLRLRPEAAAELLALLRGRALPGDVLVTLAGALGHAGTPAAQAVLAELLVQPADPCVREAAAIGASRG